MTIIFFSVAIFCFFVLSVYQAVKIYELNDELYFSSELKSKYLREKEYYKSLYFETIALKKSISEGFEKMWCITHKGEIRGKETGISVLFNSRSQARLNKNDGEKVRKAIVKVIK